MDVSFIIPTHLSTSIKNLVKIGLALSEIFGGLCQFWPCHPKSYSLSPRNLHGYWTELHQICNNVAQYSHLILNWNCSISISESQRAKWRLVCQFCPKLVAMVMPFGWLEKRFRTDPSSIYKYLSFSEKNLIYRSSRSGDNWSPRYN